MTKLEEYQAKKNQISKELEQVNRDIILTEQSIKQQEELFMQQFNTTNVDELKIIAEKYQESIASAEAELLALEQS